MDTGELLAIEDESLVVHHMAKDVLCGQCSALMFLDERLARSSQSSPKFGLCCLNGKVSLDPLPPTPAELGPLLLNEPDLTRTLNNLFAMGSMQANVLSNMNAFGPPTFVVDGGPVQRCVSHLDCPEGQQLQYCLRYSHDSSHAQLEARVAMLEARTAQVRKRPRDTCAASRDA